MKRLLLLLSILAFISGVALSLIMAPETPKQSQEVHKVPDLTLKTTTGKKINLHKTIDNKTLLLFWLPKSKSCRKQLAILEQIKNEYQDSISIYGVNIGNADQKELKKIKRENSLTYPLLIDKEAKLSEELLINAIPTLVFINSQGVITEKNVGLLKTQDLQKKIEAIKEE